MRSNSWDLAFLGVSCHLLGCSLYNDDGHKTVRCASEEALHRSKSSVNIQFSWFLVGLVVFAITFYLGLVGIHSKKVKLSSLAKEFEEMPEDSKSLGDHENPGGGMRYSSQPRHGKQARASTEVTAEGIAAAKSRDIESCPECSR
uniref:Uncharacterized protein n=1 Tax=Salix viminalis TaxID=40686 RepID=A0A6N2LNP1_SALVM